MGTNCRPNIVTEGLIAVYDAGSVRSYNSSVASTTLTNIVDSDSSNSVFEMEFSTATSGTPDTAFIRGNNSTQNSSTQLVFDVTDADSGTIPTPSATTGILTIRSKEDNQNFITFAYTSFSGPSSGIITLVGSVTSSSSSNPFSDEEDVFIGFGGSDLTINGSPTFFNGVPYDFSFNSSQITKYFIKSNFLFPTTQLTMEIWCQTQDVNRNQGLVSYAVSGDDNESLLFYGGASGQKMNIFGPNSSVQSNQALTENKWTQVVLTSLRSSGATKLYYNGVQVFSTTLDAGTNFTSNGTLVFAQEQDSPGGGFSSSQCWVGQYSIIRIYDKVLDADQVKQNFIACKSRFSIA